MRLLPPLGAVLLAVAVLTACGGGGGGSGAPERVTYQAEDGLRIVADFYAPLEGEPAPAILLLHQFNDSRAQWADLIPDILQWGYAVLAPDLRSFGESTVILRDGTEEEYELNDLDDLVLDVAAAIEYLKTRSEVDAAAIGVVGASVGGNLAYVAAGAFPEVKTTVSMSPSASPSGDALLGSDIPDFTPRVVLFMSDEAEASDAQALADSVVERVDVRIYGGKTAHGVELLDNPEVKPDIREWLTLHLGLPAMVLQPQDLPEGLVPGDASFTTNEELASASADPKVREIQLEGWGRILGYEITYQPGGAALNESPVQGINVSASLYETEEGASESFADAVKTAEETDWAANYAGLSDFQQEEVDAGDLADEIVWLQLSGLQPATDGPDALVTDDLVFFRVGRERGFLRVLASSTETEDRQHYQSTVEGWLQALVQNVADTLSEGNFEVEGGE